VEDKSAYTTSVTKRKRTRPLRDLSIDGKVIKTTNLEEVQFDEVERYHPTRSSFVRFRIAFHTSAGNYSVTS
jgi:hypothetical protein